MTDHNTQVLFNSSPEGMPTPDNFRIAEAPMPVPGDGEFLLKNLYLSLDPYQRMLMGGGWTYSPNVLKPGDLMVGRVLGEVVETNNPDFPVGTHVVGRLGWQTHVVSDGTNLDFVVAPKDGVPLSAYLGVCGSTGVTAWVGLKMTGQPKAGETVVVSAAAGSVGSCVGQLAKDMGCRAVGIAGGPDKCKLVEDEFGFDACIDYKAPNLAGQLAEAAPDEIRALEDLGVSFDRLADGRWVLQSRSRWWLVSEKGQTLSAEGNLYLSARDLASLGRFGLDWYGTKHHKAFAEALRALQIGHPTKGGLGLSIEVDAENLVPFLELLAEHGGQITRQGLRF